MLRLPDKSLPLRDGDSEQRVAPELELAVPAYSLEPPAVAGKPARGPGALTQGDSAYCVR